MSKQQRAASGSRRGGIYVLVLGLAVLCAVIGSAAVTVARLNIRTTTDSKDWDEAGVLAVSGIEVAVARMNANSQWRGEQKAGTAYPKITLGRGTATYYLYDDADGDLSNNPSDVVRIVSAGRVGNTARAFSVQAARNGNTPLDVLRCAVYTKSGVGASGTFTASGGPLCAAGTVTVGLGATLNANVDCGGLLSVLGTVNGSTTTGVAAKTMPSATVFDLYNATALTIPWGDISGGAISGGLLTSGYNTYGDDTSPNGVYSITVPTGTTLYIRNSRLQATLCVKLGSNASLVVQQANVWDPPRADMPALIVKATGTATVTFTGTASSLQESAVGVNFNPPESPYQGTSNTTTTDSYTPALNGLFHIIGASTTTNLGSNLKLNGCVLSEGTVNVSGSAVVRLPATLVASPPAGYTSDGAMVPMRGTFQWVAVPE